MKDSGIIDEKTNPEELMEPTNLFLKKPEKENLKIT